LRGQCYAAGEAQRYLFLQGSNSGVSGSRDSAYGSRQAAATMSGEKSGVKHEGNQMTANRTRLAKPAIPIPHFEQGLTCFAGSAALTLAALRHGV